jgi:hypothetical protein
LQQAVDNITICPADVSITTAKVLRSIQPPINGDLFWRAQSGRKSSKDYSPDRRTLKPDCMRRGAPKERIVSSFARRSA